MKKVVYSHWSKPSKDESLGFNSKQAFKNCAELSVLHSKKWFDKIELVTDEKGYKFLIEDEAVKIARLSLIAATQQVLKNGLYLLGVSAPEKM